MAKMGKYCKAYLAKEFSAFDGWKPDLTALRPVDGDAGADPGPRAALDDDDVIYLHDSMIVTDDVFCQQNIIFDDITDEWQAFCREKLGFEVPDLGY